MASKLYLGETHSELVRKFNELVDEFGSYLPLSGGTLTGSLTTKDLTLKGIEQFQTHYAKKLIGTLSAGTKYANLDSKYKDGTYHRMWRLRFPASCNFWGKIKITLYGNYSSFNASGIMSKSITCNFNGSSIYNNVGFYDGLGVNVEKDFRISEAIWNSTASAWEILIWQKNLSGNNSPTILIEAWSSSETYLTNVKNITAQAVELTQATTYTASKASSTGGTKTVNWATTPVYETPLGEEIATMSDIPSVPSVSVTQKLTSGTEIGSITVGKTTTKLYAPTSTGSGSYLPLSGGTLTGNLTIQQGQSINVSQYNDAGGVSLMNNGGGTATQFGSSARPARMFSSVQPEWYKNGASQGVLAIKTDIPTTLSQLTNDADYTTKSYVDSKIANLLNSAPETLDTLGELATAIQAHESEYDALLQTVGSKVKKTTQTATVIGTSKTTEAIGEYQLVFPKGAVFSGTAASAGLVTRGICGVTTPEANGSCSKENLYINYDGTNDYNAGRQLVLQAGQVGTHYGNNLYQYCAARGDAVKGYVDANTIKSLSVSGRTITYTKGDGTNGTITTQDQYVKQTHVTNNRPFSLALVGNNAQEVMSNVYKNTSLYAVPATGALYATSFYENNTALSEKYHPKKRKVTLAELRTAMRTMTTGTRIQVVPYGIDDDFLYSVGACVAYSSTYGYAYNSQTKSWFGSGGLIYYEDWRLEIGDIIAEARRLSYRANGSELVVDSEQTETLTDANTDFYILD